ncbi:hypothetical protein PVK06_027301 [Gossypium arboreum]|uniref:Uncharacterized protein n=1 Tax=Gossypium arboreum TaxID=29729 RepID=A0ABR0P3F1_GOSAR|nr:hypothetical protein PVK06_027301 [Gossypium arboreum]
MIMPLPIRIKIDVLNCNQFCDARLMPEEELMREFYANLTTPNAKEVLILKKKVLTSKSINDLFNLPNVEEDEYSAMTKNINYDFLQQVHNVVTNPGSKWIIRRYDSHSCRKEYLNPVAKEIQDFTRKKVGSVYFPSLITSLCLRDQVRSKENLKSCYVQSCITKHDLERLLENIEILNQVDPDGPNEPKCNESSTKSEPKASLINDIEEEDIGKE